MNKLASEPQEPKNVSRTYRTTPFIDSVLVRCQQDKGLAARLRRADNPNTEYQSWELLASYSIDLEKPYMRLPYATVVAAMTKAKIEQNGTLGLGQALARCYDDGNESNQAKAKLRRLLACSDVPEVCRILRGLLSLIASKSKQTQDYARLLNQLLRFHWNIDEVRAQWAQEFYSYVAPADKEAKDE